MNSGSKGRKKRWYDIGLRYALNGLIESIKTERNMKVHITATVIAIILAFVLKLSVMEWMILLLTIAMVIGMELVNTALEHALDYVAPERSSEIKIAKDIAASSVLLLSIVAFVIGLLLFLPKFIAFLT
ncbi:diacylglycerol kinase [Gracilibacillus halotolerans]|uniref:Diacylglycerol kinase n=1 Tax=Gracilibacillus halotolerans TaxID=74386 RepID=A0A841RCZ2_9BACI|nr:diacylglycerol kinase family protein [Gracilibacillus halotolerans]MBB6511820.1 diacylglycerol kinase [Gracilibacillus halotolerans]